MLGHSDVQHPNISITVANPRTTAASPMRDAPLPVNAQHTPHASLLRESVLVPGDVIYHMSGAEHIQLGYNQWRFFKIQGLPEQQGDLMVSLTQMTGSTFMPVMLTLRVDVHPTDTEYVARSAVTEKMRSTLTHSMTVHNGQTVYLGVHGMLHSGSQKQDLQGARF